MIARLLVTVSSLSSNPQKQRHEIFRFRFFSWIIYPQAPENNIRVISNFCRKFAEIFTSKCAPLVSTTKAANLPPVSLHQWQIMETILDWWHLTGNLKEKIHLYVNSPNQRCPKKIIKTFPIEFFFHLPPMVVHHELRIPRRFLEKILNGLKGILRGMGETVSWKKPEKTEVENLVALSLYGVFLV